MPNFFPLIMCPYFMRIQRGGHANFFFFDLAHTCQILVVVCTSRLASIDFVDFFHRLREPASTFFIDDKALILLDFGVISCKT